MKELTTKEEGKVQERENTSMVVFCFCFLLVFEQNN